MLHYLTTEDCRRLALKSFLNDMSGGALDELDTATSWGDCEEWGREICDVCERKESIELPTVSPTTHGKNKNQQKRSLFFSILSSLLRPSSTRYCCSASSPEGNPV